MYILLKKKKKKKIMIFLITFKKVTKPSNQEKPSHQIYKSFCHFRLVSD